jgi:outer membrane immunogenic protein
VKKIVLASIAMIGIATANAGAADLPVKAPPMVPTVTGWTGFYVGANIGYGWGRTGADLIDNSTGLAIPNAILGGTIPSTYGLKERGVIGGGQFGYNWRKDNWVWGLEADLQGAGIRDAVAFSNSATPAFPRLFPTQSAGEAGLNWFGTVRGRMGYVWKDALLYATGGLAYGQPFESISNHVVPPPPQGSFSASEFRAGWALGAGVEWALTSAWSVKAEYLHVDLGTSTGRTHPGPVDFLEYEFHHTYEIARVGINYRWGAGPVVARY